MRLTPLFLFLTLLSVALAAGCAPGQHLRLRNSGTVPIADLRVLYPGEQVAFGALAPGATTEYKTFVKGVYRYAAYSYSQNGAMVTQPVTDWVGEAPMEGTAFTYTLVFDPATRFIQLENVERDQ